MSDCQPPSSPGSACTPEKKPRRRALRRHERAVVDILALDSYVRARVVTRQIPVKLRGAMTFRVREWQGRPWVTAYVMEIDAGGRRYATWLMPSEYRERIVVSAELEDGDKLFDNKIIQRCRIPDELLAFLALTT